MNLLIIDQAFGLATTPFTAQDLEENVYAINPFQDERDKRISSHSYLEAIETDRETASDTFAPQAKLIAEALIVDGDGEEGYWDTLTRQVIVDAIHTAVRDSSENTWQYESVPSLLQMVCRVLEKQTQSKFQSGRLEKEM